MGVWDDLQKPEVHARLLTHPRQLAVRDTVASLIAELRLVVERAQLRVIQEHLLGALVDAEHEYARQSRLNKRGEGDPVDLMFWRRAVSQFRTVGDGIAWRFLDYRRQWILLFGLNDPPGMWSDKVGANAEWEAFNRHWDAGEPALLTGLTASIRQGDLLVANDDALVVYEVKSNAKSFRSRQRRGLERLVRQVNEEPRIPREQGETWILESDVSYASYWTGASGEIRRALDGGLATWVPTPGVAVMVTAGRFSDMRSPEAVERRLAKVQADAAARMGRVTHRVVTRTFERPASVIRAAPPSIYPVDSDLASLIVSGEMLLTVEVSVDHLVEHLASEGIEAEIMLPQSHGSLRSSDGLVRWRVGRRGGVIRAGTMNDLALDLTDLSAWARAIATAPTPPSQRRWGTYLCLAQEGQVWSPRLP